MLKREAMLEAKDSDELRRRLDRLEWKIDSVPSVNLMSCNRV